MENTQGQVSKGRQIGGNQSSRRLHGAIRRRIEAYLSGRTWSWLADASGVPQSTLSNQVNRPRFGRRPSPVMLRGKWIGVGRVRAPRDVSRKWTAAGPGMILVLGVFSGCGPGDSGSVGRSAAFLRWDSAGVLISVTPGEEAETPLGWAVDSLPALALGADGSPSGPLFRVQGVRGLPEGGVLVVDGGSRELRFFDARGSLVRRVGRQGEGPGEFGDPVLVSSSVADSLLVFDKRLPRFQLFSIDGEDPRTLRHMNGWPSGRRPPVGALGLHVLFERGGSIGGEARARRDGVVREYRRYFWYDPLLGGQTPVDSFAFDFAFNAPEISFLIPFAAVSSATVGPNEAWISDGRAPEIRGFDIQGRLRRIFRVDQVGRPVSEALIQSSIGQQYALMPESRAGLWEDLYAGAPIPHTLPPFQSLRIDERGWLWAERNPWDPAQPTEWLVFDLEGRARGTIRTPPGLDVRWIGEDRILGVWKDDLGVEFVRQHGLRRGERPEQSAQLDGADRGIREDR